MLNAYPVLLRLDEVERISRLRICDGILESTVLRDRREWLSCLDLVMHVMEICRSDLQNLLGTPPGDTASDVKAWIHVRQPAMLKSVKEGVMQRKGRRVYLLGLVDQWEVGMQLLDDAIDESFRRGPVKQQKTESTGKQET